MRPQSIRSLALLGSVSLAAANDIVSLILPFADEQDLVGEVLGSSGSTTTYALFCADYTDESQCGMPTDGMTVAAGPTAFVYEYTFEDYYLRQSCVHSGTTWVSCEVTNSQSDMSIVTSDSTSVDLPYMPVTITATATDADSEPTSTSEPESSATDSDSDSSSTTLTGSVTESESPSVTAQPSQTPSSSASPTTDAEEAEETDPDNAAGSLAAGSTQWLVAGAGMAIALAMA